MANKSSAYLNEDGEEATIDELTTAFLHSKTVLLAKHLNIYHSTDMKVGIDVKLLASSAKLLQELVTIDPRGGFFIQKHVAKALEKSLDADSQSQLLARTLEFAKTLPEVFELLGYKVRVMLSHLRLTFDSSSDDPNHPLASIFQVMKEGASGAAASSSLDARKSRRQARLATRPNPFVCFRGDPEEEVEKKTDQPTKVMSFYDGKVRLARMLMSDGSLINADNYVQGKGGFIVAHWANAGETLELEVSNSRLEHGRITEPQTLKRPAAAPSTSGKRAKEEKTKEEAEVETKTEEVEKQEDVEEEEEEQQEDVEEEEKEITVKIRPGHDNEMTLVAFGEISSDKAQILSVSPAMCPEGSSPTDVCKQVMDLLEPDLKELYAPAKGAEWLPSLRNLARLHRQNVCSCS